MNLVFVLIVGILCNKITAEGLLSPSAVQIVSLKNHTFNLEFNEFEKIINNEKLKDRNVIVVSIAGAYRQGKSFLLNFFIKYLQAQVII